MKFRKKPIVIEAMLWDGEEETANEILKWADGNVLWHRKHKSIAIPTLEGAMNASIGDWIIRGVNGEFYPCKPDIFEATYEPVVERETHV
jgi:hypothetical protein